MSEAYTRTMTYEVLTAYARTVRQEEHYRYPPASVFVDWETGTDPGPVLEALASLGWTEMAAVGPDGRKTLSHPDLDDVKLALFCVTPGAVDGRHTRAGYALACVDYCALVPDWALRLDDLRSLVT